MTKAQWLHLSDKARWDIMVAMRGPDSHCGETIKWFTTAVLRGQMQDCFRVGGAVNNDLQLIVLPQDFSSDYLRDTPKNKKGVWNCRHFLEHVQTAAQWIALPVLQVPTEIWHAAMLESIAKPAAKQILRWARGSDNKYQQQQTLELERHYKKYLRGVDLGMEEQ